MRKVSSSATSFYKRVFPILWFGLCGLFILIFWPMAFDVDNNFIRLIVLSAPLSLLIIGYFFLIKQTRSLADEVYDEGSSLLIKKSGKEVRVNLKDIRNVRFYSSKRSQIILSLNITTAFGEQISFIPDVEFGLNPVKAPKFATELKDRVNKIQSNTTKHPSNDGKND